MAHERSNCLRWTAGFFSKYDVVSGDHNTSRNNLKKTKIIQHIEKKKLKLNDDQLEQLNFELSEHAEAFLRIGAHKQKNAKKRMVGVPYFFVHCRDRSCIFGNKRTDTTVELNGRWVFHALQVTGS